VEKRRYILILPVFLLTTLLVAGCSAPEKPEITVEEFPICIDSARH